MQPSKRVLIAGLFHETHTFIPGETTLADCNIYYAEAMIAGAGDASPLGGALDEARALGWEIVAAVDIRAMPGPIVSDEVVERWWNVVQSTVEIDRTPDGIFLVLHGAMVSRGFQDVEGELLQRLRKLVGPDVPIGGVTDLHANFSARMAQNSNALVTYRENPHTDGRETAVRAAHILDEIMDSREQVETLFEPTPIAWPPTGTATAADPMMALEARARELEAAHESILAINVHAGYSFSDVPDAGVSFSAVSCGAPEIAREALRELAAIAWEMRESGNVVEPSFDFLWPQIEKLLREQGAGPIVLAEPSDNIGGGAPGDGTGLLRALLQREISSVAVVLNDPSAVEQLQNCALAEKRLMQLGGASAISGAGPLELEVEFVSASDGKFVLEDAQSHLAAMNGENIDMGPCVTVRHSTASGVVWILLTTLKTPPFDLGQLRSQGIVPEEMAVIAAKAAVAHRRAYDPIARASFSVATPGVCSSDLKTLPYRNIRRPIFPLDAVA